MYRILTGASIELDSLKNEYEELQKSEEIRKIIKQIEEIDDKVDNCLEYYNENISIYNSLLKKFPSNVVATYVCSSL